MSVSCFFIQHHARKNLLLFSHFWYNCMYKNQGAPPHLILPMIPLLSICIKICETLFLVSVRQRMFLVFQSGQQTLARRKQRNICFQRNREWMKTQTNAGQCALCFSDGDCIGGSVAEHPGMSTRICASSKLSIPTLIENKCCFHMQ